MNENKSCSHIHQKNPDTCEKCGYDYCCEFGKYQECDRYNPKRVMTLLIPLIPENEKLQLPIQDNYAFIEERIKMECWNGETGGEFCLDKEHEERCRKID